jgi:hypothetical protein
MTVSISINGTKHDVDVGGHTPVLWVREVLGTTGTKYGCGIAQHSACAVHVDGKPVRSCLLPVGAVGSRAVTTIEGIGATEAASLGRPPAGEQPTISSNGGCVVRHSKNRPPTGDMGQQRQFRRL